MTQAYSENPDAMDVAYVAHLARLKLTDDETSQFQQQLDQILDYVNQLNKLDVEGIEPTGANHGLNNVFREDEPRESLSHERALRNAPAERQGHFSVPRIIE